MTDKRTTTMIIKHPQKDIKGANTNSKSERICPDHLVVNVKKDFGRIYERIVACWGSKECIDYLNNLVMIEPNRNNRAGFPLHILTELHAVLEEHNKQFPKFVKHDIWFDGIA